MISYQMFLVSDGARHLIMDTRLPAGPRVGAPTIVDEANSASVLTFDVAMSHPLFDALTLRNSWIEVAEAGVAGVERFRVIDADGPGIDGVSSVTAEGVMAVLNDSVQPHWAHKGPPTQLIDRILANHNGQMRRPDGSPDPMRQIRRGLISSDLGDGAPIDRVVDAWPYPVTMDALKRSTWDSATGGHVRVRTAEDGVNYLDWSSTGSLSAQVIRFGGTLQEWHRTMTGSGIVTACEPLGKKLKSETEGEDRRLALTLADQADLLYVDSDGLEHYGVINQEAAKVYGLIVASMTWDDIEDASTLLRRAAEHVAENSLTEVSVTASVVDQHLIDPQIAQLTVFDRARFVVPAIGIDQTMTVARRKRSLVDVGDWSIELGAKRSSLSDAINRGERAADQVIELASSNVRMGQAVREVQHDVTAAWAGSPNLIRDSSFSTDADADGWLGRDSLEFRAAGCGLLLPTPATSCARITGNLNCYVTGVHGEGLPTAPVDRGRGRTYRFTVDVAYAGEGDHPFGFRVTQRRGGKWVWAAGLDVERPTSEQAADSRFTRYSWTWTAAADADQFRPGIGSYSTKGTNSTWWVTNFSVVDVTEAQSAANAAADVARTVDRVETGAAQTNLVRDSCFAKNSSVDHLTNIGGAIGADVAGAALVFNASGFTGTLPSPAKSYAKTVAANDYYVRGARGGDGGLPTAPGRTYRLSIDAAFAGEGDHPFGFRVFRRRRGTWVAADDQLDQEPPAMCDMVTPTGAEPDSGFTRYSWLWTAGNEVDLFRPGFGSSAKTGANSTWWVTNFTVTDVTESQKVRDEVNLVTETVKKVESRVNQLSGEVSSVVAERYVTETAFEKAKKEFRSEVKQTAGEVALTFLSNSETVTGLQNDISAESEERTTMIRLSGDGVEVGKTDSRTKTLVSDDGMEIRVQGAQVARFASGGAVVSQLRIGDRILEPSPDKRGLWIRRAS
ncbi:MAG: phage tail protein [Propionibacteriaceae bacterium]|jgi:hypothetical protein|nr:phage tail protein [Propionibacteriaceae bacterium]